MKQEFFLMHCHRRSGAAQPEDFGNFLPGTGVINVLAGTAAACSAGGEALGFAVSAGFEGAAGFAAGAAGGAGAGFSSTGSGASSAMQQSSSCAAPSERASGIGASGKCSSMSARNPGFAASM
eukprot:CAMPEP_0178407682 /NCGR_PEP_ID=MMETSP0689_2-20121128/19552_1 /TAXON_ID=160604 /ORGANISM="Amphidinium massartii, Strain CS-259" /LENGTH=122 /DNA_ID=CAMNT_0020028759 /DNA_START=388 /DNA_END=756 /DNA_ORIENTATION=-